MATPLIAAIQSAHKEAQIHLLTSPPFAPIFAAWQDLVVHAYPRRGWRAMIDIMRFIRRAGFQRIYDLQGNDRTSLICALSGVTERVGNHNRFPYTHHPADRWRGDIHIFKRMKLVLRSAGVDVKRDLPILPVSIDNQQCVAHWLSRYETMADKLVGLHAGASAARPEKCWPYFAAFARRLIAHQYMPIWLGATADKTRNEKLIEQSGGINASGEFNIPELALFGENLAFAVTNDSGPMHVLAAGGKPIYGLFGPSDWRRNHALGQADNVILPPNNSGDLNDISVDYVWQRLIADQRVASTNRE